MIKGFSLDGLQPPAGGDCLKNIVFMVRGVSHNLNCPFQGLGSVQVLKMCQIAASYLLSTVNDTLQYDFVIVSGSSISCVNEGEYSFVNGEREVHYHYFWQVATGSATVGVHFLLREFIFSTHLRFWVIKEWKDSTVSTVESHRMVRMVSP